MHFLLAHMCGKRVKIKEIVKKNNHMNMRISIILSVKEGASNVLILNDAEMVFFVCVY